MNSIIHPKDKKIKHVDREKKKNFWTSNVLFFILILVFSSSLSFFLGKISMQNSVHNKQIGQVKIEQSKKEENPQVVASKKGSVYHLLWCSGAVRLKNENKIFFKNKNDAEKAGYRAAKNCEGL